MNRNVEIKAKARDADTIREIAAEIADRGPFIVEQEDTFFRCRSGRIKLRRFSEAEGELIYYERGNEAGPKLCTYIISRTLEPDRVRDILSKTSPVHGVVKKRRVVYTVGQTRIHLDDVEGLGEFVELECVLSPGQDAVEGIQQIESLMERLGISKEDIIDKSYIDLLSDRTV